MNKVVNAYWEGPSAEDPKVKNIKSSAKNL